MVCSLVTCDSYCSFFCLFLFYLFYSSRENINNKCPCTSSTGHSLEQFEEIFWKIPLGRYISEATQKMQMEFFHRYLQDFISMTMKVTSVVNLEVRVRVVQRYISIHHLHVQAHILVHISVFTF